MSASLLQTAKESYLSGDTRNLEKHHIMNGANRDKSERFGLWVWLTHDEHMKLHGTPEGAKLARTLKAEAQEAFEKYYSRERWMKEFRRNYL